MSFQSQMFPFPCHTALCAWNNNDKKKKKLSQEVDHCSFLKLKTEVSIIVWCQTWLKIPVNWLNQNVKSNCYLFWIWHSDLLNYLSTKKQMNLLSNVIKNTLNQVWNHIKNTLKYWFLHILVSKFLHVHIELKCFFFFFQFSKIARILWCWMLLNSDIQHEIIDPTKCKHKCYIWLPTKIRKQDHVKIVNLRFSLFSFDFTSGKIKPWQIFFSRQDFRYWY